MSSVAEQKTQEEQKERIENIDYKMVTFSLAGKDYGIDIMKVDEITKARKFTYVPNSAPYVRGVYSLRGEIISIIDLRKMFHLQAPEKDADAPESVLILKLEEHILGVVVDSIDKIVGISSESIQPPHPIFGDINIKYISGVVENDERLYIILDVDRIFARRQEEEEPEVRSQRMLAEPAALASGTPEEAESETDVKEASTAIVEAPKADLDLTFVSEELATFADFHASDVNRAWLESRLRHWRESRREAGKEIQLTAKAEAQEFLAPFASSYSRALWGKEYLDEVKATLPAIAGGTVSVWNPGCAEGYETYSLACLLKDTYPEKRIKIWGNDADLLAISTAPSLSLDGVDVPEYAEPYTVESNNGLQFSSEVKDLILFEYHDIMHENPFPEVDIVLARDVLSFFPPAEQQRLLGEFRDKLRKGGTLIVGDNESAEGVEGLEPVGEGRVRAYRKTES
jgi:purine-binding chemotaxis protein CheW